jgi:hypothetical protein
LSPSLGCKDHAKLLSREVIHDVTGGGLSLSASEQSRNVAFEQQLLVVTQHCVELALSNRIESPLVPLFKRSGTGATPGERQEQGSIATIV